MKTVESAFYEHAMCQGQLLVNESLADYTTWRVGGVASQLYKPAGLADLVLFLKSISDTETLHWLGLGSNTLVRDGGIKGTVILTQNCLNDITLVDSNTIRVEAGVSCAKMARFCARNHLSGGEFWAGIPGTMGGALRMNAGCFNGETWQYVKEIETINKKGKLQTRQASDFDVSYRHVDGLAEDEWFVSATCELDSGDKATSLAQIKQLLARRTQTQPTNEYNCGSVFRNPPNQFAAHLIESCGLKGMKIGHAKVSEKHANFIINDAGRATAADIESLIEHVHSEIKKQAGILLTREVQIIGEKSND